MVQQRWVNAAFLIWVTGMLLWGGTPSLAGDYEFAGVEGEFRSFLTCEMTRTGADSYFNGSPFKITMIDVFEVRKEGNLTIITGTVRCSVKDKFEVLYAAVGVESIMGKKQVNYCTIRKKDFSILATELMKYPYKERCPWSRYWVDLD